MVNVKEMSDHCSGVSGRELARNVEEGNVRRMLMQPSGLGVSIPTVAKPLLTQIFASGLSPSMWGQGGR